MATIANESSTCGMSNYKSREDAISALFINGIDLIYTEKDRIFVVIKEDEHWWENKCVLSDTYFDYKKLKSYIGWNVDCHDYGVFVFLYFSRSS